MLIMAALSITMFMGITLSPTPTTIVPSEHETVVSQLARGVFGGRGLPYYYVQVATMLILVLAANTAYADFPRLASFLARDRTCRASSSTRATGWPSRTASSVLSVLPRCCSSSSAATRTR